MLLVLLCIAQDVDALGHPDPEERLRAADALRGAEALPALLGALRHPDPEVRGRVDDLLRSLSPLAWLSRLDHPALLRYARTTSPATGTAEAFLDEALFDAKTVRDVLKMAPIHLQAVLPTGDVADLPVDQVTWVPSEGVLWVGRGLETPPALLPWLLGRLHDPAALTMLAQMLPAADLLKEARPEAVDILLVRQALYRGEPIDPRLAERLASRLPALDERLYAALSIVFSDQGAKVVPALNAAARSSSRAFRYLAAAAAAPGIDSTAFLPLLRDPAFEIRREAVRAVLLRVAPEAWDPLALLEAVEGLPDRGPSLKLLRGAWNPRLRAAAVEHIRRTPEAALAVLEDCEDPATLDAALAAMAGQPVLARSTALLRRMTETSEDPWPRDRLKELFADADEDVGRRAAYALGGLPPREILPFFEARLNERALWGIRRLGARAGGDSCVTSRLRTVLRERAEVEEDARLAGFFLDLAEETEFPDLAPWRMGGGRRMLVARSGCGHRRHNGGWRPLPPPAIPLPAWKD